MKTVRGWLVGVLALAWCVVGAHAWAQRTHEGPRIDGFDVEEVEALSPGTALRFTLYGTPGASATLRIEGARRVLALPEVEKGRYEGTYTVADDDGIMPRSRVNAELRVESRVANARLDEPLVLGATVDPTCDACGVVQAIHAVPHRGGSGFIGAVIGGVLGAILGDEVGRGDGRAAARVLGAVGGAYAGHRIERANGRERHDIIVRMDSGAMQTRRVEGAPRVSVGERVRVVRDSVLRESELDPR